MKIHSASEHLGAIAEGVDLAAVVERNDTTTLDALRAALRDRIVVLFPRQTLTPDQILALGRHFGPLMDLKRPSSDAVHLDGLDNIKAISNARTADGRPVGDGSNRAQDWHSDGAMQELPATYTWFYARKVPPVPPRTEWLNMYAVYAALPEAERRRIDGLEVIHHKYLAGNEFPLPPSLPLEERMRGPRHPLVRVHPETGRPFLYIPHRDDALVVGLDEAESRALIAGLRRFAAATPFRWGAALAVDDFVVWDNRPALHRRDAWDDGQDRILWHLANVGERPVPFRADAAPAALRP